MVALATAKRVGKLQALSATIARRGEDIVLSFFPSFMAKTESIVNVLPKSFVLKSLRDFAGDLEEGSSLCPVRAVLIYLDKTSLVGCLPRSLFISARSSFTPMFKNLSPFLFVGHR